MKGINVPQHLEDGQKMRASLDSAGRGGQISLYIATFSVVLGVIGGILHAILGIEVMSWFLLAIVTFSVTFLIGWAVYRYSEAAATQKGE